MAKRTFPSFYIYKDRAGEYRWSYEASNGRTIADSGEGYISKADCRRGIDIMMATTNTTKVWKSSDVE